MTEEQPFGSKKFFSTLTEEIKPIIEETIRDRRSFDVLRNILFDKSGPRSMKIITTNRDEKLRKILFGFTEIDVSIKVLNDIPFYIKHFPPKNSNVSKTRFLNYHVGNYFNEMYILRERLVAYQKVITRIYKNDQRLVEMGNQIRHLEFLISGFDNIVDVRGKHVHQNRYDDNDFTRLTFFENMYDHVDPRTPMVDRLYKSILREQQKKWGKTISNNNEAIEETLDIYFEILYHIIFDKNGKFIDPDNGE